MQHFLFQVLFMFFAVFFPKFSQVEGEEKKEREKKI
jgi:hypothetical protein